MENIIEPKIEVLEDTTEIPLVNELTEEDVEDVNVITSETTQKPFEFVQRELSDDELTEKKLQLMDAKLSKEKSDLALAEMERQLDAKVPLKFIDDDIKGLEEDIANKVKKGENGKEPATESDIEYMNIRLEFLKKTRELEIPMKELRLNIQSLRHNKERFDSKENQIKKLEKEIRERSETTISTRLPESPKMVG